jgi:flagella basal body P-ring formation protein FlgA
MRWNFPFLVFCAYNMVQQQAVAGTALLNTAGTALLNTAGTALLNTAGTALPNTAGTALPNTAQQALPNTLVTLTGTVIRVSDLFSNAGPEANEVLGAAPAPGGRIVVGSGQLAAIAAAYQVPWQPDGSDAEVVLASPGSAMPVSQISAAIADAIAASGGPADAAVTLPDFTPPMIPPGATPNIAVTRISFDPASSNFSASLVVDAAGMAPQNLDLAGLALPSVQALVASHDLAPGEVLTAADLSFARLPQNQAGGALTSADAAIGMAVNSGVQAGGAVTSGNLVAPIVVRKGMFVVLNLAAPGMILTAQGIALGDGGVGSMVSVLNPASHAVVQAAVTGPGTASIAPGSTPLSSPQNQGGYGGSGSSYVQAHGSAPMTVQP